MELREKYNATRKAKRQAMTPEEKEQEAIKHRRWLCTEKNLKEWASVTAELRRRMGYDRG